MQNRLNKFFGNLIEGASLRFPDMNKYSFSVKFSHDGQKYILSYGCEVTKERKENRYFFFCNFTYDGWENYNKEKYRELTKLVGSGQSGKKNLFHTCGKDNAGLEQYLFDCADYIGDFAEKVPSVHMNQKIYEGL